MAIEQLIKQVVEEVPAGKTFDSHFVIQQLIERDSDEYLRFASQYVGSTRVTLTTHQQIGHQRTEDVSLIVSFWPEGVPEVRVGGDRLTLLGGSSEN